MRKRNATYSDRYDVFVVKYHLFVLKLIRVC